MFYRIFILLILLISNLTCADALQNFCDPNSLWTDPWNFKKYCYCNGKRTKILPLIDECDNFIRQRFLGSLPPYRESWEREYHQKFNEIYSPWSHSPALRFPDVHKNMLINDQLIDLVREYHIEKYRRWAEDRRCTKQEKDEIPSHLATLSENWALCKQKLQDCRSKVINKYVILFERCLKSHSNLVTYHDYGLLAYLCNNFDKSFEMLTKFVKDSESTGALNNLDSKIYHELGTVCFEAMKHDQSIEYLTEAINKDPTNKALYFDRALSYFETGDFDLAIKDYLESDYYKNIPDAVYETRSLWDRYKEIDTSVEFKMALFQSLAQGSAEAAVEFVPSLLNSVYGLGEALWIKAYNFDAQNLTADKMLDSVHCFANTCYEMGECATQYCREVDWDTVDNSIEEIKKLYAQFDSLSDKEKGELIGYTIGKYGADVLFPGAALKGVAVYKNLKNANRMCNLEAMTSSAANEKIIRTAALNRFAEREAFFDRIKLSVGKQNKHRVKHKNYKKGNSVFEHPDPEGLLNKFKGTGTPVKGSYSGAGHVETVDFKEHIGIWISEDGKQMLPTTRGAIHYSKQNAHIVPAHPTELTGMY